MKNTKLIIKYLRAYRKYNKNFTEEWIKKVIGEYTGMKIIEMGKEGDPRIIQPKGEGSITVSFIQHNK